MFLWTVYLLVVDMLSWWCMTFRRESWPLHSICALWQQLVDETKEEARERSALGELYAGQLATLISQRSEDLQKISRKVGGRFQNFYLYIIHSSADLAGIHIKLFCFIGKHRRSSEAIIYQRALNLKLHWNRFGRKRY